MFSSFESLRARIGLRSSTTPSMAEQFVLEPTRSHWQLMLSTEMSAPFTPANLDKLTDILEKWLVGKWPALHQNEGFSDGHLELLETDQMVRFERGGNGLVMELVQRLDRSVWVTSICVVHAEVDLDIQVQNGVFSGPSQTFAPSTPAFLRQIAESLEAVDGGIPVADDGFEVNDDASFEQLLDDLSSDTRQFPIVVVSPVNGDSDYCLDVDQLARWLHGVAHVVTLDRAATQRLESYTGRKLSVPRGGSRLYMPGFDVGAMKDKHPVFYMPQTVRKGPVHTHRGMQSHIKNLAFKPRPSLRSASYRAAHAG